MAGTHYSSSNSMTTTSTTTHLEKKRSLSPESFEEVREVDISSFEQAAECLSQAFAVDEVARYFVDTDDMRHASEEVKYKLHCDIIRYITAAHCYKGLVTTIGPDFDAVALWCVPTLFLHLTANQPYIFPYPTPIPNSFLALNLSYSIKLPNVQQFQIIYTLKKANPYPCSSHSGSPQEEM